MPSIRRCELPQGALLSKYQLGSAYADCYVTEVAGRVSHAEYVEAFYTTTLVKVERSLLSWLVSKPSTDLQARQLAVHLAELRPPPDSLGTSGTKEPDRADLDGDLCLDHSGKQRRDDRLRPEPPSRHTSFQDGPTLHA